MTTFYYCPIDEHNRKPSETPRRCLEPVADSVCGLELEGRAACDRPVHVDEGWPPGQCLRESKHTGRCDVYDGRQKVFFEPLASTREQGKPK